VIGPVAGGRLAHPSPEISKVSGGTTSTPEAALNFVMANPSVTVALSGMSTLEQVKQNIAVAEKAHDLTEDDWKTIAKNLDEVKGLADLYCTGCNYCMPCPHGVDIPANFEAMNMHKVWGLTEVATERYANLGKKKDGDEVVEAWAESCEECGECEPKCPQHIPIIEQLKETAAALGAK